MQVTKEIKIGLTATFILLITVWGINFLKGKNILKPTDSYYATFDRIDGLIESGAVYHRGFKVGNINGIEFDHKNTNKFIIGITLEEPLDIPLKSTIKVKSSSLIASANDLEIVFSTNQQYHQPGDTLSSEENIGISDILEPMQKQIIGIMSGFDSLLVSLNEVLNQEGITNLQQTIDGLNESLNGVQRELKPGGTISHTLLNLESISANLENKNDEIAKAITHLANLSAQLDTANLPSVVQKLDSTLINISSLSAKMDNGEGTAGMLMNDSSLYYNLDSTAYYLSVLLKDMQENPKRYVHFSLLGNKKD